MRNLITGLLLFALAANTYPQQITTFDDWRNASIVDRSKFCDEIAKELMPNEPNRFQQMTSALLFRYLESKSKTYRYSLEESVRRFKRLYNENFSKRPKLI